MTSDKTMSSIDTVNLGGGQAGLGRGSFPPIAGPTGCIGSWDALAAVHLSDGPPPNYLTRGVVFPKETKL